MQDQLYWHIELYSGEIIKVKPSPEKIKYIQDMIAKQEGAVTTPTRSIIIKDIRDFRASDEIYTDQKLLEGAAQAFKEPQETEYGIKSRWVKRSVPQRKWETYFKYIPSYKLLNNDGSFIEMAFKLPIHLIDSRVQELTQDEEFRLAKVQY